MSVDLCAPKKEGNLLISGGLSSTFRPIVGGFPRQITSGFTNHRGRKPVMRNS